MAAQQRAREALGLSPLVSASSSASLSAASPALVSSGSDRRLVDTLEVRLAKAAQAAERRNEQLRLDTEAAQVVKFY